MSVNEVRQCTRSEAFRLIVGELQEIMMSLADDHSYQYGMYYGRFTTSVALFLLAKLALNTPIYADEN